MNITQDILTRAWLAVLHDEWAAGVRDTGRGYPGDRFRITQFFEACGWLPWVEERSDDGLYRETYIEGGKVRYQQWCGMFPGWGATGPRFSAKVAELAGLKQCVGVELDPRVRESVLPSTYRLASFQIDADDRWEAVGLEHPILVERFEDIRPGDIVTTGAKWYGSHINTAIGTPSSDGTLRTIAGNGVGTLGKGAQEFPELAGLSKSDLQDLAQGARLSTDGSKSEILERIKDSANKRPEGVVMNTRRADEIRMVIRFRPSHWGLE